MTSRTIMRTVLRTSDRAVLTTTIVLASLYVMLLVYGAVRSLSQKLGGGEYLFTLPGNFPDNAVAFPHLGSATVLEAHQSMDIYLTVGHVSGGVVALVVAQHVLSLLTAGVVAGAVIYLCVRLLRHKPFVRSMSRVLAAAAAALIVFGSAAELVTNWVNALVQQEITGGSLATPLGGNWGFTFTGVWLMVGLGLAAVAGAFRIGERMQRDTDGLV